MNPDTVKKLLEDVPEAKELLAYIDACASELNTIIDIPFPIADPQELAIEVIARHRAYEKLLKILEPFVNAQIAHTPGVKADEYAVDVDTPQAKQ